jgi:hypothetical protein
MTPLASLDEKTHYEIENLSNLEVNFLYIKVCRKIALFEIMLKKM